MKTHLLSQYAFQAFTCELNVHKLALLPDLPAFSHCLQHLSPSYNRISFQQFTGTLLVSPPPHSFALHHQPTL